MIYTCYYCERPVDWQEEGSIIIILNHPLEDSEQYKYCSYKCVRKDIA
jgi:endogenous inhibitor of DNA gyrase (YacG/DUF329 family)